MNFGPFHFLKAFSIGISHICIPVGWEDDHFEGEFWRRYETRCISIQRDKPLSWEPNRPCYFKWRYDGRPQRILAAFGICIRIGNWPIDFHLNKDD